MEKCKCAGILPFALEPKTNNLYFLLGRESFDGSYSDFGGGTKEGESAMDTAIREFDEESMGLICHPEALRNDLENQLFSFVLVHDNRTTYVKQIRFQPELPERFLAARNKYLVETETPLPEILEKTQILWFSVNRLHTMIRNEKISHYGNHARLRKYFVNTLQLVLDVFLVHNKEKE